MTATATSPELSLCPHCGGMTVLAEAPRVQYLRWVCGACGGPRVPGAPGKNAALARARVAQAAALGWSAGSIALALSGALTSGLGALLWGMSQGFGGVVFALGAMFLMLAWRASARARGRRKDAADDVREGWREGARAIVAASGSGMTAAALAGVMRVTPAEAEELLTLMAADEEASAASSSLGDGDLRFRVRALEPETARTIEEQKEIAEAEARAGVDGDAPKGSRA